MAGKIDYKVFPLAVGTFSAFFAFTGVIVHGFFNFPSVLLPFLQQLYSGYSFTSPYWIAVSLVVMFILGWAYALAFAYIYNLFAAAFSKRPGRNRK